MGGYVTFPRLLCSPGQGRYNKRGGIAKWGSWGRLLGGSGLRKLEVVTAAAVRDSDRVASGPPTQKACHGFPRRLRPHGGGGSRVQSIWAAAET